MSGVAPTDFWGSVGDFIRTYRVPFSIVIVILITVIVTVIATMLVRRITKRVLVAAQRKQREARGHPASNDQIIRRTRTASTLAINVIIWLQVAIAGVLILGILGVNLTAVLASAGVLAAVLTFGAQNIIKDLLSGLFLVMEDQIDVGDVVDTGLGAGVVETVGIRVTQLRDGSGRLWSIRNGEIVRIVNSSRGWLRIVLDLEFDPATDADAATTLVLDAMNAAIESSGDREHVLEAPSSGGIIGFSGSGVTIRFLVQVTAASSDRLSPILRAAARNAILGSADVRLAQPRWGELPAAG